MNLGLVLSGGGGKGAYQIGVWRALQELGLERHITVISGTSVGALNAALFLKGDLAGAERIWSKISNRKLLMQQETENQDSFFSNEGLQLLIEEALRSKDRNDIVACYAACKRISNGEIRYYDLRPIIDPDYRKNILLASTALPGIYPAVEINGELYTDGGANGDNTPVRPVCLHRPDAIIVVHLSTEEKPCSSSCADFEVIDIYPSESLGGFLTGTINFSAQQAEQRRKLGYRDGMRMLCNLADRAMLDDLPVRSPPKPLAISRKVYGERSPGTNYKQSEKKETNKMEQIKFQNEEVRRQYEKRMEELKELARSSNVTNKVLWDASVDRYVTTVEKVRALMQQPELKDDIPGRLDQQMQAFFDKCAKPEFHIALVGTIKAGKSTLINAILGENLASTEVTPETAALTKFRGSKSQNYVSIQFYSNKEWQKLWASAKETGGSKYLEEYETLKADKEKDKWINHVPMNIACEDVAKLKEEIRKWTSSQSATHYFVKEVEVALKNLDLPEGVILVDTPGLNDGVAYRSNITKNYIDRANAVLVCVKADKLSSEELSTIYGVFANSRYNPEKVYIVATQQDSLNNPVDDWKKQQANWLDYLKDSICYGNESLARKKLISTAAYFHIVLSKLKKGESLDKAQKRLLQIDAMKFMDLFETEEIMRNFDALLTYTGVDGLKRRMEDEIISKHRNLLVKDIENSYEQLKERALETITEIRKRQNEFIAASSKSLEEIREMEEQAKRDLEEAKQDKDELNAIYDKLKKESNDRKKKIKESIRSLGG